MPSVRLSRLASHPRALRGSSAYPNRTCGRHWRPTPRREEASTNTVERSGGEPAMLRSPRLRNTLCFLTALGTVFVLAIAPVAAKPAKNTSLMVSTPKQGPVRTDLTPRNKNECLAVAQTLNEQAKKLSQQTKQGVSREFTRVGLDLGRIVAKRTSKRHGSVSNG